MQVEYLQETEQCVFNLHREKFGAGTDEIKKKKKDA